MKFPRLRYWLAIGVLSAFAGLATGCASLKPNSQDALPVQGAAARPPTYVVELQNQFGAPTIYTGQLEGNVTIQDALTAAGAFGRYRNMEIDLVRPVPEKGRILNLAVELQPSRKEVKYEQNYAVLAGDRIVVGPKSNGPLSLFGGGNDRD